MKYCFGVDIGGTTVKLGLFTTDGEIVDKWEIKTRTENQGEAVLPDIAEALKEKLEEKKIGRDEVEGIGVGVPAPVDAEGVVQNTANLGWGYKEVKREHFSRSENIPARLNTGYLDIINYYKRIADHTYNI